MKGFSTKNTRNLGKLGTVYPLGFGCMRLPVFEDGSINEPVAIDMIRTAVDNGVDYIDTAHGYLGGKSEIVTGKALKDGYREKVRLATKLPMWHVNGADDFDRLINEQLERLQVSHIDFYLLHALNKSYFDDKVIGYKLFDKLEKAKSDGIIKHIGFSFHDSYDVYTHILNGYDNWEFCQIQLNYMNIDYQAGLQGLKDAAEKGLAVIIMEPLLGGKLSAPAKSAVEIFKASNPDRTPVEWALDWLWNMPEVSVILSGMSTKQQVLDNLAYAERSRVNMLSESELKAITDATNALMDIKSIECTKCGYCMPCPSGVDIPRNFDIYNETFKYEDISFAKGSYNWMKAESKDAKTPKNCSKCMACEAACPQSLKITDLLDKVHNTFEG